MLRRCAGFTLICTRHAPRVSVLQSLPLPVAARWLSSPSFKNSPKPQHGALWRTFNSEGLALFKSGKIMPALKAFQAVIEQQHGHEGFPFAMSLSNIAACLRRLGRRTEAEAAYRRSIHIFRMLPQSESDPWALARACIDYGRLLEDAAAALPAADKQSPADHTRRVQLLARAVLAYRSALAGGLPQPPPVKLGAGTSTSGGSGSQTSPAAHNSNTTIEERQDEARLYFALASAQFTLSEQFAPPPAPAADATDATDEDADGAGAGAGDSALASAPTPAAPSAHSAASMPKAPTASAWWLPLLDAPDLFAPSPSDAAPHSKSSSAASSAPAASAAAVGGPLSADIVEAESAMTALIASRLGTGTGGARLDPEAQAALLFAAERSMRVAASCALQAYGDHVQTAEALSSLGTLCAALGNVSGMRMHYSACLEMLHRLQDVDRFAAVLLDFVTLCVQAGVDQQQLRGLMELLQAMKAQKLAKELKQKAASAAPAEK